ncbi:MAG TPA: radical SAM protein, partial [Bacteroidia bacterium]
MKVLFAHSYFLHFDPKQEQTKTPYAPLATLYAASYAREHGYEVDLFDVQFCEDPNELKDKLSYFRPDVFVIYDDGFNYLTKMCLTNMRDAAWEMQRLAKQYGCSVIVSSSDATDHIDEYIKNGADIIIIGEAEQTLLELLDSIKLKSEVARVDGIAFIQNNNIQKNPSRNVLKNLDSLPKPAWDLVNIEPYKKTWIDKHGYFTFNLVTTRGCPYKCNWCAKPIYGNRYNAHSPAYIVELIEETQQLFGYTHIWFADDIFGLKPNWLKEFRDLVKEKNISVKYKIQSRADLLLEPSSIQYLAESGCEHVWMGAESGSQKVLDAMDKGIKVEEIIRSARLLKAHGIKPSLFLQFGYPGETMEDIQKTMNMVLEVMPEDIGISVSYPLPGTGFYEKVKSELVHKTNWTDSDDLDLMFRNNYSKDFYKQLHRYVHY